MKGPTCPHAEGIGATHLLVVRSQDNPAAERVPQVDHPRTGAEAEDFGQRGLHGENEHLENNRSSGWVGGRKLAGRTRQRTECQPRRRFWELTLYV